MKVEMLLNVSSKTKDIFLITKINGAKILVNIFHVMENSKCNSTTCN